MLFLGFFLTLHCSAGYQGTLQTVRTRLAHYTGTRTEDLVLVENASAGVNAVLRSLADALPLKAGDAIMLMDIAYPMVCLFDCLVSLSILILNARLVVLSALPMLGPSYVLLVFAAWRRCAMW